MPIDPHYADVVSAVTSGCRRRRAPCPPPPCRRRAPVLLRRAASARTASRPWPHTRLFLPLSLQTLDRARRSSSCSRRRRTPASPPLPLPPSCSPPPLLSPSPSRAIPASWRWGPGAWGAAALAEALQIPTDQVALALGTLAVVLPDGRRVGGRPPRRDPLPLPDGPSARPHTVASSPPARPLGAQHEKSGSPPALAREVGRTQGTGRGPIKIHALCKICCYGRRCAIVVIDLQVFVRGCRCLVFVHGSAVLQRQSNRFCIHYCSTLLVALKTLVVVHRLLQEGDPTFRDTLILHKGAYSADLKVQG